MFLKFILKEKLQKKQWGNSMYKFNVAIELHADFCGGFYKRLNSVLRTLQFF